MVSVGLLKIITFERLVKNKLYIKISLDKNYPNAT
jgi:hypothetical protein